jgi:hypothetical protein
MNWKRNTGIFFDEGERACKLISMCRMHWYFFPHDRTLSQRTLDELKAIMNFAMLGTYWQSTLVCNAEMFFFEPDAITSDESTGPYNVNCLGQLTSLIDKLEGKSYNMISQHNVEIADPSFKGGRQWFGLR